MIGMFCEAMVFAKSLNDAETLAVESYLQAKWGTGL
jgi:hypothetical protein